MIQHLQRMSTEYIVGEDRIRLSGEVENAASVVIWLTQRLLQRLLPAVLNWLEGQGVDTPYSEIMHSFAQQAARAELTSQTPVLAVAASSVWLAQSVELGHSEQTLSLTFRGAEGQHATLVPGSKQLLQWLSIVFDVCQKAEWSLDQWPAWLRENGLPDKQKAVMLH